MDIFSRKNIACVAVCAILVSCSNSGGDEFPTISWNDREAAAVGFLGLHQKEDELRNSRLLEKYSLSYGLSDIPTVSASGDEWYLVIPRWPDSKVEVDGLELDEDCQMKETSRLYESDGKPFLLRCNISDIYGNTVIHITGSDGETLDYTPTMSLENGLLTRSDYVRDITDRFKPVKPQASVHYDVHELLAEEVGFSQIKAFVRDGKAFVSLPQRVDECPAGEYEIEGLSGKCRGLFIGDIGQDINPIVCLAMENGGVEVFSVFSATQNGDFRSSGLLDGFENIEAFQDSTMVEMFDGEIVGGGYVTVFAFDKNGEAKEIELCPSGGAEISSLSTGEDGRATEHKLLLEPDWKIRHTTNPYEGDPIEEYRGRIRQLKADYDNYVFEYSYEFTEHLTIGGDGIANEEKTGLKGSFRMVTGNNGYVVTPLSGTLSFGSKDGDGIFYEYSFMRDTPRSEDGEDW